MTKSIILCPLLYMMMLLSISCAKSSPVPRPDTTEIQSVEELIELARKCPAEVGFHAQNFTTGKTIEYRPDQPACLASIVKLFVLLEVAQQAHEGNLALTDSIEVPRSSKEGEVYIIRDALDDMIGNSDNDVTNALAKRVGYKQVNALADELGIEGLSKEILPEGDLDKLLNKRVFKTRMLSKTERWPQHGTARGMVQYFELLHQKKLINEKISHQVLKILNRNPKPFAPARPVEYYSVGKGGSLVWERVLKPQYNMVGWALYLHNDNEAAAMCVWFEWFKRSIKEDEKNQWIDAISNGITKLLVQEHPTERKIPDYLIGLEVVQAKAGVETWEELLKSKDNQLFKENLAKAVISDSAAKGIEVIPIVACRDLPKTAHFTWRWKSPDGSYGGTEIEFPKGGLWGWLPHVKLDQTGTWQFEIGLNGQKVLNRTITVPK